MATPCPNRGSLVGDFFSAHWNLWMPQNRTVVKQVLRSHTRKTYKAKARTPGFFATLSLLSQTDGILTLPLIKSFPPLLLCLYNFKRKVKFQMYRRVDQPSAPSMDAGGRNRETARPVVGKVQKQMSGRYSDIWLSFSIVTLPMLTFSALLLGLVYCYRVTHGTAASINLQTPDIASWSSSLGPLLAGFVMSLASYPLSRQFWNDVQDQEPSLPTPFQFALILKFITSSGWGALYGWIRYLARWKEQRQLQSRLLTASASVTALATILGYDLSVDQEPRGTAYRE
jgi:hypothetical protein